MAKYKLYASAHSPDVDSISWTTTTEANSLDEATQLAHRFALEKTKENIPTLHLISYPNMVNEMESCALISKVADKPRFYTELWESYLNQYIHYFAELQTPYINNPFYGIAGTVTAPVPCNDTTFTTSIHS